MSLSFKKLGIIFSVIFCLFQNTSHAQVSDELTSLIEITAEYYPSETYHIGLELNSDHSLNRVYYENNAKIKRFFSIEDLKKRVVLMTAKNGDSTVNLVYLGVRPMSDGKFNFIISYMRNGLFKTGSIKSVNYTVQYNSSNQSYIVTDNQSERLISRAHVLTNFWFSKAVGIDKIQTN